MTASNALGAQQAPDQQVTPAVRAQMADPAAWAVTAFATTSFMLGMYQTGILNAVGTPIVLPAAFFFGGLVQIIVAVLAWYHAAGDVIAAPFGRKILPAGPPPIK